MQQLARAAEELQHCSFLDGLSVPAGLKTSFAEFRRPSNRRLISAYLGSAIGVQPPANSYGTLAQPYRDP